jgi:hypothetical protein
MLYSRSSDVLDQCPLHGLSSPSKHLTRRYTCMWCTSSVLWRIDWLEYHDTNTIDDCVKQAVIPLLERGVNPSVCDCAIGGVAYCTRPGLLVCDAPCSRWLYRVGELAAALKQDHHRSSGVRNIIQNEVWLPPVR